LPGCGVAPRETVRAVDGVFACLPCRRPGDPAERQAAMAKKPAIWKTCSIGIPHNIPGKSKGDKFKWLFNYCLEYHNWRNSVGYEGFVWFDNCGREPDVECLDNWIIQVKSIVFSLFEHLEEAEDTNNPILIGLDREAIHDVFEIGVALLKIGVPYPESIEKATTILLCLNRYWTSKNQIMTIGSPLRTSILSSYCDIRKYINDLHFVLCEIHIKYFLDDPESIDNIDQVRPFSFHSDFALFKGKPFELPKGKCTKVLGMLARISSKVVSYDKLIGSPDLPNDDSDLRKVVCMVNKSLAVAGIPYEIENKRGKGYYLKSLK
jgi:hypothetical protein